METLHNTFDVFIECEIKPQSGRYTGLIRAEIATWNSAISNILTVELDDTEIQVLKNRLKRAIVGEIHKWTTVHNEHYHGPEAHKTLQKSFFNTVKDDEFNQLELF